MFSHYDGAWARLYDLREDPATSDDAAGKRPHVVRWMSDDYILKDAGGALPDYDV